MKIFGLDISDSVIRLAVLDRQRSKFKLPVRGEIPVPEGYIIDGDIKQPHDVSALLRQLMDAASPKTKYAVVSLPERHSFIKVLTLTRDDGELRESDVKAEVAQSLPYAWDELYTDWHVLPKRNSLGQVQVIFASAPKTIIDGYLQVLHDAGIEPVSLEVESVAIARALLPQDNHAGTEILLDMGRTRTSVALVHDGVVYFSTTLRYAGKDLNQYISDELHISDDQAERAKTLFGLDPKRGKGLLRKVLSPQLDILAAKIKEIESFYIEHFVDHQPIQRIILNGSGALVKDIDQALAERLDIPVVSQPSWISQELAVTPAQVGPDIGYQYTTALGLALEHYTSLL